MRRRRRWHRQHRQHRRRARIPVATEAPPPPLLPLHSQFRPFGHHPKHLLVEQRLAVPVPVPVPEPELVLAQHPCFRSSLPRSPAQQARL
mmetsp:Transcript_28488/g.92339  ORF Transcript_28488/g.92339 Transcript_28488/m.92339 type:complete len:90 (+) Transcript_28488:633-902(+)